MTFPFTTADSALLPGDIDRLSGYFHRTVADFLPCDSVRMVAVTDDGPSDDESLPESWSAPLAEAGKLGKPLADSTMRQLFLPLEDSGKVFAVAVLAGGHHDLYQAPENWLLAQGRHIVREVRLLKQGFTDPATSLFNGRHLREEIQLQLLMMQQPATNDAVEQPSREHFTLLLLELYPHARNAAKAMPYIGRAAAFLDSLFDHSSTVHHFGAGVFGLFWPGVQEDRALKMADGLLQRLRREKMTGGHIGLVSIARKDVEKDATPETFVEQAWQALGTARRRGPFALCAVHDQLNHPLKPPDPLTQAALGRMWRGRQTFALVLLCRDRESGSAVADMPAESDRFPGRVIALLGRDIPALAINRREAYVFLDGADAKQAQDRVADFKEKARASGEGSFSAGIAVYPCQDFKKSAMPLNARKALIHTAFFGPDTMTVFDGVSLNISGDVYYNEGDMPRALKEYRKGLALDPANLNLLNSVGVTYAQLNRQQLAIPYFEKALEVDGNNYMALFNLGLAYLTTGREEEAVDSFERALGVDERHFDLFLQLGRVCCRTGRYQRAVEVLTRSLSDEFRGERRDVDCATVHRCLGEAYKGLGDHRQAMTDLQRAIRYNPRDAASLSLLGELYALEKQGDAIALSLCSQAVSLDDGQWRCWYRLGVVQREQGDLENAVTSLKRCLSLDRGNVRASLLLGRVHEQQGLRRDAARMYERVLKFEPGHEPAAAALAGLGK